MIVRTVDLTGLDDHDWRSASGCVERDVVGSPLRVFVRGGGRRRWAMTLGHDRAMRVAKCGDRGDIDDPRNPRGSRRVQNATSTGDVRLLHRAAALRTDADLVDRGAVNERVTATEVASHRGRLDDVAGDELAPERGKRCRTRGISHERRDRVTTRVKR